MRVEWDSVPIAAGMRPGATRQGIAGVNLSAVRVHTAANASFDESALHRHDNEQLLVMVEGSLQLEVDRQRYWVNQGDLAVFSPGQLHGAVGVGESGAVYFEIFSPPRYDQLPGFYGPSPLSFDE